MGTPALLLPKPEEQISPESVGLLSLLGLPHAQRSSHEDVICQDSHSLDLVKGQGDLCKEKHIKAGTDGHW